MFCSQCGKQIEDNAKFCKYCGNLLNSQNKSIVNTPTHYKGQADPVMMVHLTPKIIYALLMIACTIFSALGGLIPSISVSLWSYSKECSVRDIWKLLSSLEDWGLDIEGFRMVLLVITGGYLVSAIAGVVMLLALLQRKKKYSFQWNETKSGKDTVIHNNDFENQQFKNWENEVLADYILLDIY